MTLMTNPTTIARHRRDQRDGGQRGRRLRAGLGPDQPRRAPYRPEYKGAIVVRSKAGDTVINQIGGYFHGDFTDVPGVNFALTSGTIVNASLIASRQGPSGSSANGVDMSAGGVVTNLSTGTITGGGVFITGSAGTVINSGKILGDGIHGGVDPARGGTIANLAGTIASNGGGYGVQVIGGAGTVTNAATIAGGGSTGSAILPAAGFANRVIVDLGAVFVGTVSGGTPGLSTLELASSASIGTVIGFASQYLRFGALIFDASSHWLEEADTAISVPIINGFGAGETIVLTGFAAISKTFASNPLVLTDSGGGHVLFKQRCRRASNWAGSLNQ
jgi:hypothetical protein